MRMPRITTSPRRLLLYFGLFLLARLEAHPELSGLAALWKKALDLLEGVLGASDAATKARVRARAVLEYADQRLDNEVRAVAAAAKSDLGGRTGGPDWSRLFHVAFGDVVRLPIPREIEEVKLIETELASGGVWVMAKSRLASLTAARQALEKAGADYHVAQTASEKAERRVDEAVEQWRAQYRSIFGALTERFPRDRTFVTSFFWRPKADPKGEKPAKPAA